MKTIKELAAEYKKKKRPVVIRRGEQRGYLKKDRQKKEDIGDWAERQINYLKKKK